MLQIIITGKVAVVDSWQTSEGDVAAAFAISVSTFSKKGGRGEFIAWVYCPSWMNKRVEKLVQLDKYIGVRAGELKFSVTVEAGKGTAVPMLHAEDLFIL